MDNVELVISAQRHCPSCGARLTRDRAADCLQEVMVCAHRHSYVVLRPVHIGNGVVADILLEHVADQSLDSVAERWLSDEAGRLQLHDELAALLRVFRYGPGAQPAAPSRYCPCCGGELVKYEQPDVWVLGLRCSQGHEWTERGGRIGGCVAGTWRGLETTLSSRQAARLATTWLKNPQLATYVPESIRPILEALRHRH